MEYNGQTFKDFDAASDCVLQTYRDMTINQTYSKVQELKAKYLKFEEKIDFWELFYRLNSFVDLSDPDIDLPNEQHAYQTAEKIRQDGYPEWMQVIGLIHDMGKAIFFRGCDEDGTSLEAQWALVGDTFVVGCKIPDNPNLVHHRFRELSSDYNNPLYSTELGIYQKGCGMNKLEISFGHDEYLYHMLLKNKSKLPKKALYMARFHSLYAWHTNEEYTQFENSEDKEMKSWVQLFNKYDLYTKCETLYDREKMKAYYGPLISKYIGDKVSF